ncbi:sialic acid-binding Ig-like lectin 12 isoform X2 [Xenopus tropicalis]|uniref:Sialic acid-binding Ig-like lectin 12 isoform X2 n=1 Tax=Xenopus tropicalis TaxID=8364 RepID=A0A8J1JUH8_XENTR|nr:sialic acid-binding Ig-like lectin 12 isoform X2 [Xenopus tropicalis]
MMERYRHLHRIILMVVLQGGFPGSYSQDWAITLPESIRALRGSCVEIPCTFTRPRGNKDFRLVWYKEKLLFDNIIFSQWDPSDVSEGYRGRTSLVGNEPNNCSLRIIGVQESRIYFPYIHGNCYFSLTTNPPCQTVQVTVSDVPNEPAIQIPTDLTEGERTPISCSVEHTCPPRPPTLQWNRAGYNTTYNQKRLKDGVWKAETVMEYLPSYRDHGAELICEATYPNGLRSQRWVTLNIRSAPTGEGLPTRTLRGGGAVAVLVILLALALYLFLRHRKSQKGGESGGRGAEANVQNPQATESPYINVQIKDTAMYEDMKPAESPYTALQTRDTAVYYGIKNSQPTESPYTALQTRDTAVYYIIKPQIHQQNRSK